MPLQDVADRRQVLHVHRGAEHLRNSNQNQVVKRSVVVVEGKDNRVDGTIGFEIDFERRG